MNASRRDLFCSYQATLKYIQTLAFFITLQPLSHRRNVAKSINSTSIFMVDVLDGRCSEEFHSLVPALRSFPVRTRFAVTVHPYYVNVHVLW